MTDAACHCKYPEGAKELFCERHRCGKFRRLVELCNLGAQGEAAGLPYWRAWEEGRGPGQADGEPAGALKTPKRVQARKLACKECPDGHWNESQGFCPLMASQSCGMQSLFSGTRVACKHWPE